MSSLAQRNLAAMREQMAEGAVWVDAPKGGMMKLTPINSDFGGLGSTRAKLDIFLNELSSRHVPHEVICLNFLTTNHFAERLNLDRSHHFNRKWVSTLFSILFNKQCDEFIKVLSKAVAGDRVQLIMNGSTIAVEKVVNTRGVGYTIKLVTIYVGTAQNKDHTYHTLNINTGD